MTEKRESMAEKPRADGTTTLPAPNPVLVTELRQLIDAARQRAATAVNAELTRLYWQVGERIHRDILGSQRAGYGEAIIPTLSKQLTVDYGRGFSAKNLRHMLRFAEAFPDEEKVSALRRQLSWTHIKALIYLDDPLKRDFYTELCRLEGWSSRQLQERIQSLLFERSAISRQPEETIQHDLQQLRREEPPSPALLLKDRPLPPRLSRPPRPLSGKRPRRRHLARDRAIPVGAGRRLHLRRPAKTATDR